MFVEMKRQADFVGSYLSTNGFLSVTMHGGRFQEQREEALSAFRSNKFRVLVATSVAARGLGECCWSFFKFVKDICLCVCVGKEYKRVAACVVIGQKQMFYLHCIDSFCSTQFYQ